MKRQIPIRYEEGLEKDVQKVSEILGAYGWNSKSKNQAFVQSLILISKLVDKIQLKNKKQLSPYELRDKIEKFVS